MGMTANENHYRVLEVLHRCGQRKYTPTLAEIGTICGYKAPTVYFYLRKLIAEGLVTCERRKKNIQLLPEAIEFLETFKSSDGFVRELIVKKSTTKNEKSATRKKRCAEIKQKRKMSEQECFEAAVTLGLSRNNVIVSDDVTLARGPLFRNRVIGYKVG